MDERPHDDGVSVEESGSETGFQESAVEVLAGSTSVAEEPSPDPQEIATKRRRRLLAELGEYVNALIIAIVLAAFIMTFVARSFLVQGASMEPTFRTGERLLVNKFIYRFVAPSRGDIVVFKYPMDPKRMFIKRVIGVPGEEIMVSQGIVYVNGVPLDEPYIAERPWQDFGPVVVPDGKVFVMGDNRNMSQDSRDESVGMVPRRGIEGKAFVVYWPVTRIRLCPRARYISGVNRVLQALSSVWR